MGVFGCVEMSISVTPKLFACVSENREFFGGLFAYSKPAVCGQFFRT